MDNSGVNWSINIPVTNSTIDVREAARWSFVILLTMLMFAAIF